MVHCNFPPCSYRSSNSNKAALREPPSSGAKLCDEKHPGKSNSSLFRHHHTHTHTPRLHMQTLRCCVPTLPAKCLNQSPWGMYSTSSPSLQVTLTDKLHQRSKDFGLFPGRPPVWNSNTVWFRQTLGKVNFLPSACARVQIWPGRVKIGSNRFVFCVCLRDVRVAVLDKG